MSHTQRPTSNNWTLNFDIDETAAKSLRDALLKNTRSSSHRVARRIFSGRAYTGAPVCETCAVC